MTNQQKQIKILLLLSGLVLCTAVLPLWPAFYYIAVRGFVFVVCVYTALRFRTDADLSCHVWPLAIEAMVFNPLLPTYESRFIWLPLNLAGALYLLHLSKKLQ